MRAFVMAASFALTLAAGAAHAQSSEEQDLRELRYTVINLLGSLVEQGVITQEQAEAMVARAQREAAEQAAADAAAQPELKDDDVRVTYVPEFVRDEIREEIREELRDGIVADVKAEARDEGWGVPAALPNWLRRVSEYPAIFVLVHRASSTRRITHWEPTSTSTPSTPLAVSIARALPRFAIPAKIATSSTAVSALR